MDAPRGAGLEEPLLFPVELPDSFEGELEPFVNPVTKPLALLVGPEGWEGDPTFVGVE